MKTNSPVLVYVIPKLKEGAKIGIITDSSFFGAEACSNFFEIRRGNEHFRWSLFEVRGKQEEAWMFAIFPIFHYWPIIVYRHLQMTDECSFMATLCVDGTKQEESVKRDIIYLRCKFIIVVQSVPIVTV